MHVYTVLPCKPIVINAQDSISYTIYYILLEDKLCYAEGMIEKTDFRIPGHIYKYTIYNYVHVYTIPSSFDESAKTYLASNAITVIRLVDSTLAYCVIRFLHSSQFSKRQCSHPSSFSKDQNSFQLQVIKLQEKFNRVSYNISLLSRFWIIYINILEFSKGTLLVSILKWWTPY